MNETDCGVYVLESAERILPDLDSMFDEARKVYASQMALYHMHLKDQTLLEPSIIGAVKKVANKRWTKDWFSSADVVFKRRAMIELMQCMRELSKEQQHKA
jgi:hypothetical protein